MNASNIYGRMAKTVLPYLLAMHAVPRDVFLCVVDEDADGDDDALHAGLAKWAAGYANAKELLILTSTMPRAAAAAAALAEAAGVAAPASRGQLAPISNPTLRPTTPAAPHPSSDGSFKNRFGESVRNLVGRLEPIALEIEGATCPVLVIAHEAPCRSLRALFLRSTQTDLGIGARESVDASFAAGAQAAPSLFEYKPTEDNASFTELEHKL